jgi:serine/threonine protein phosphatase PrpC
MSDKKLKLQMVAKTDVGRVRDHNEDNFIVTDNYSKEWIVPQAIYANSTHGTIMVVADGMGGLNAGEVASQITVDSVKEYFNTLIPHKFSELVLQNNLISAILYAHKQIISFSKINVETEGMGTTAVLAQVYENKLFVAWSGDSRCYLFRNNKLIQITKDHSYVQSLFDEGKITKEQAFYHPQSNIITQSLGDKDRPPVPSFAMEYLYKNDIIILCSDGLNAMIEDATIESIISNYQNDINYCSELLIQAANDAGGNDNITIILNQVIEGEINTSEPSNLDDLTLQESTLSGDTNKIKKSHLSLILTLWGSFLVAIGLFFLNNYFNKKMKMIVPDSTKIIRNDSVQKMDSKRIVTEGNSPLEQPNSKNDKVPKKNKVEKEGMTTTVIEEKKEVKPFVIQETKIKAAVEEEQKLNKINRSKNDLEIIQEDINKIKSEESKDGKDDKKEVLLKKNQEVKPVDALITPIKKNKKDQ